MRKRISITEGELRRLIEGALNELAPETYLNAYRKADRLAADAKANGGYDDVNDRRAAEFRRAAKRSIEDTYFKGDPHKLADISPKAGSIYYYDGNKDTGNTYDQYDFYPDGGPDLRDASGRVIREPSVQHTFQRDGENDPYYSRNYRLSASKFRDPALKRMARYYSGNAEYRDGKWRDKRDGENESFARKISGKIVGKIISEAAGEGSPEECVLYASYDGSNGFRAFSVESGMSVNRLMDASVMYDTDKNRRLLQEYADEYAGIHLCFQLRSIDRRKVNFQTRREGRK